MSELETLLKRYDASVKCRTKLETYRIIELLRQELMELRAENAGRDKRPANPWCQRCFPEDGS